jgi:hypothetical protein
MTSSNDGTLPLNMVFNLDDATHVARMLVVDSYIIV